MRVSLAFPARFRASEIISSLELEKLMWYVPSTCWPSLIAFDTSGPVLVRQLVDWWAVTGYGLACYASGSDFRSADALAWD